MSYDFDEDQITLYVKGSNINEVGQFLSTTNNVYISFYPNNCNDFLYDDYSKSIMFGAINCNTFYQAYISSTSNNIKRNIISFDERNIISHVDIIPSNKNISLGTTTNRWNNIYINSNIYLGNIIISADNSSNITISGSLNASNIYNTSLITTNQLTANNITVYSNISSFNVTVNNLFASNTIQANTIAVSNLIIYNSFRTNDIINNSIYTNTIYSSNIINTSTITTSSLTSSNIFTFTIYSSNIYIYDTAYVNKLIVNTTSYLGGAINITNDFIPTSNNFYNLGSVNKKWKNLYISSNLYIGNTLISFIQSNVILSGDIYANNIYANSNINSSNIIVYNSVYTSGSLTSKNIIANNTIYTTNIIASNQIFALNSIDAINIINSNTIYTNILITSNSLYNFNTITTPNLIASNIATNYLFSSNTIIYNMITINNLIVSNIATLNGAILNNDLLISSNDCYNIGSFNYKFKNIYLSSNIYLGNYKISAINSNIYINTDVYTNNIYTNNITANNIVLNNSNISITTNGTIFSKTIINCNIIYSDSLIVSNILSYDTITAKNIIVNNTINSDTISSSNLLVYNTIITNSLIASNINSKYIYSSNISIVNTINTAYLNVSNILKLYGTTIISSDIIPSQDNKYSLGSSNMRWKDLYLSNGSLHIDNIIISGDTKNGGIKITDTSNVYQQLTISSLKLQSSTNTSNFIIISVNKNGLLTFINSSNNSSLGISYKDLIDTPFIYINPNTLFSSNNLIFNQPLVSSNTTILYGKVGINTDNPRTDLDIRGTVIASSFQGSFIGDGYSLSNINGSNIIGIISVSQGGSGCNSLPYGSVLIGNNNNPVITSPNLIWSNMTNTLIVKGSIIANNISGKFIGNGFGLSNINANNIIGTLSVSQGGTGCNILTYGSILVGNNSSPVIVSSNLIWSNTINTLNVYGTINTNTIKCNNFISTQNILVGNGSGITNIFASNITGIISVAQGGSGCNILPYGSILIGNGTNPVITSSDLTLNMSIVSPQLIVNGDMNVSKNITAQYLYGNGSGITNIIASNISGVLSQSQGGTGYNTLPYGAILVGNALNTSPLIISSNFSWSNTTNTLNVNGKIYANNIRGAFVGNGSGLSNIIASNIIGVLSVSQGGTGCNLLTYGNILIGNNNNPVITSPNFVWSNTTNTLFVNGPVYANKIQGAFIGDGYGISNIIASNIIGILNVNQGGTGCNILPYGSIIIGNNTAPVITSTNLIWSNITNTLNINGSIYANTIQGNFIGDGSGLSNLNSSNFTGIFSVIQGGTGCNFIPYGQLLIGNNSNSIITTSNLYWDFNKNQLNIIGNLKTQNVTVYNNIYTNTIQSGYFIGDGSGLSNIFASNIVGIVSVSKGGTGCNLLPYGNILVGNNSDPIITSANLVWSNITNKLIVNGSVIANNIQGSFIGNGSGLYNIVASNIIGVLLVSQGGTGCNLLPYGSIVVGNNNDPVITSTNLIWSNVTNSLYVNGNVYANSIQGGFIGDGSGLSNIIASNIFGVLSISQGGTGCNVLPYGSIIVGNNSDPVITSTNLLWSDITNTLIINGSVVANNIQGRFLGDGYGISNINASNIVGVLSISQGGTGCNILPYGNILIGNNTDPILTSANLVWSNITNSLYINGDVYANSIQGAFIGDGSGLSNIFTSNIIGILSVSQGGTGCDILSYGNIVVGNNKDPVITSPNLIWSNVINTLIVKGSIVANNIQGGFIGDGYGLSNIIVSNIVGILSVSQGGTGCNLLPYGCIIVGNNKDPVITSTNLVWSNITNSLYVNGSIYANNIQGGFIGDGSGLSNIVASNIIGVLSVSQGGTGCNILPYGNILIGNNTNPIITSANLIWSNTTNTLFVNGSVYANNIQGGFIGDGSGISNIIVSNLIGTLAVINGGTGCNIIPYGNVLVGNNFGPLITSKNLIWSNITNTLFVNGSVYANIIQGYFIGDGSGISNIIASNIIGVLSVSQGGTGCNILPYGNVLIGNNTNPIITSANLKWDIETNTLIVNNNIITSNITTNSLYSDYIYSKKIQGYFIGDGSGLSNIYTSNLIGIVSVSQGGTGCNLVPYGSILVGNNTSPVITSPNLIWSNTTNTLTVNGNIYSSKIFGKFIGDGSGLSNIVASNIIGILSVSQGGTGCNILPYGCILIGNGINSVNTSTDLLWSNIEKSLIINGNVNAKNFQGIFNGSYYGLNYASYYSSNILGIISLENGGTGCNSIPYGQLIIGNYSNAIITTPNLYWDNDKNNLIINGNIYANNFNGNVFASNIVGVISVNNGGTGCNILPSGQLLIGNNKSLLTTNNLSWDNNSNLLKVNGTIIANIIQGSFSGDGYELSNINISNILGNISVINGGTGCNFLTYGNILVGNNNKPIISTRNLYWNELANTLNINGNIYANKVYGKYYGDGSELSNIVASNLIGILPISNGGIGTSFVQINQILIGNNSDGIVTSPNFTWNNTTKLLYVNGDMNVNTIAAENIKGFTSSNIIGTFKIANGGTGCNSIPYGQIIVGNGSDSLISSPNFIWSNITNELFINGNVAATYIQGNLIGDGTNIYNFSSTNINGIVSFANGGTGCNFIPYGHLLIGNNSNPLITNKNLIWDNNKLTVNGDIVAKNIQGKFIGDGYGISNIFTCNIIFGIINVNNGGTGCNIIPYGHIVVGNDTNPIITSPNLTWNNLKNSLTINGNLFTKNIQGMFYGDGTNISNIIVSNIIGLIPVIHGGTGCNFLPYGNILVGNDTNPLITSSNLLWNNITNTLNVNGDIFSKTLNINNYLYSSTLQGKYYGDGTNISNIIASNIIGILSVANGGTGSNFFNLNEIILGNNTNPLITYPQLKWNNITNELLIKGNIISDKIYGTFYGDGTNISNFIASNLIGIVSVNNGGTGCNSIPYGQLITGNNKNPIITSPNLIWDNLNNTLTVSGNIFVNEITVNKNIYSETLPSSKFIGDGANISNFVASNILGLISVINGGTGRSSLPYSEVLLGNDENPLISTSFFNWNNNTNVLNVSNSINTTSFICDVIFTSNIIITGTIIANNSINNTIIAKNIQGNFYGDGTNISNFNGNNISGIVPVFNGGTGCNNIPYGQIIIGNNSNAILTTVDLIWDPILKKLNVNGDIIANNINLSQNLYANTMQGNFYGDGINISNIICNNIIGPGILPFIYGGTGMSNIPKNQILIGNGDSLITTSNFTWDNTQNILNINGTINANNINTLDTINCSNINITNDLIVNKSIHTSIVANTVQGNFYGDGINISNLIGSNLYGVVNVNNGGTGCNLLPYGYLLVGNNKNPLITTYNLRWDNSLNALYVNGTISTNNINISDTLYANNIQGSFCGDGINISNIIASNIIGPGILSVQNGGTGYSNIPAMQLLIGNGSEKLFTTSNLYWNNNLSSLTVNGSINTNNIDVSTNIKCSNLTVLNNMTVNKSIHNSIVTNTITGKFIGDGANISNIIASNIIGIISVSCGGTGCNFLEYGHLLIGNKSNPIITSSNLIWNNNTNYLTINGNIQANEIHTINNVYSKTIQGKFIGDGYNISNISLNDFRGVLNVYNGGIGTSFVPTTRILYGNDSDIINGSDNFTWNDNFSTLAVNGTILTNYLTSYISIYAYDITIANTITANTGIFDTITANKLYGNFYGDGSELSNIICSNIIGVLSVNNGGTGCNIIPYGHFIIGNNTDPIITTSNLIWDIDKNNLNINGNINVNNIFISNDLYVNKIYGDFYGDGTNISNIIASNIIGNNIISVSNGGTGRTSIPINEILVGNNEDAIYSTPNFIWDNSLNKLNINGSVYTNTFTASDTIYGNNIHITNSINSTSAKINNLYTNIIQGCFIGDGNGLSNLALDNFIGTLQVVNGGTGCNILPFGQLIIGNNSNAVITTSNLIWNDNNLIVNGDIYTNSLFSTSNIYANYIQGKFYGDGINLSNISANNISSGIVSVINGGTGCSILPLNNILVGNNTNPLITTDNFKWNNSLNTLNVNGTVNTTILNASTSVSSTTVNIINSLTANNGIFNSSIYSYNIQGSFIGDGSGLSNIFTCNLIGILSVNNGGTGCNSFIPGQLLVGNGTSPILTSSNLIWDQTNNNLIINGSINTNNLYASQNIYANNIQGGFYGDGTNITNIVSSNIVGSYTIPVNNGGTGLTSVTSGRFIVGNTSSSLIATSGNLTWNNSSSTLIVGGTLTINGTLNVTNTNIFVTAGTNTMNNLTSDKATFTTSLYSPIIQGSFYGDGTNISNIIASNIIGTISVSQGGTGCNILPYGQLLIGNDNNPIITTSNLLWINNTLIVNGNIVTSNINIINSLIVNNLETSNLNTIGWDSINNVYNGIKYNNKPFYISLYLTNNINSIPSPYAIPFSVNYSTNGGMISSSSNIEPTFWNNNHIIIPTKGLYSINYSICCSSASYYIWLNKTSDFTNTNNYTNRFGIQNNNSTSIIVNTLANDNWYFIVYNGTDILISNNYYGNTKASISLMQSIV